MHAKEKTGISFPLCFYCRKHFIIGNYSNASGALNDRQSDLTRPDILERLYQWLQSMTR
jgi:hypothetical protein